MNTSLEQPVGRSEVPRETFIRGWRDLHKGLEPLQKPL